MSLKAHVMDSVEIYCPLYNDTVTQDQAEYNIIYMVSEFGYKNCILDNERPVGQCFSPYSDTTIRIVFREFTPLPNGLEFQPGRSYYFITTSDGTVEGVHNRRGGLCSERNMRLRVIMMSEFDETTNELERHPISPKFRHDSGREVNHKPKNQQTSKQVIHRLAKDHAPFTGGNQDDEGTIVEPVLLNGPHGGRGNRPAGRLSQLSVYEYSNAIPPASWGPTPLPRNMDFQTAVQEPVLLYEIHEAPYLDLNLFSSRGVVEKASNCIVTIAVALVASVIMRILS
ncbi:unnamed protein product [Soboliphyme baturini]|uniref:Ephrin RBD domain-containing protein n=1 Tax=Soboliphyme baturini TaxID=241478 RepID=A0A183IZ79_9BILA|nr:unnamed protein product [Soboliphyme baturini]